MALRSATSTGTPQQRGGSHAVGWPLATLALAVVVFMQIGTFARPLGDLGPVRAADWLDLLTPWAVVGAAAWVLVRCRAATVGAPADRLAWGLLAVGGLAFAEGKGLHLAANSVGNTAPVGAAAEIAHLWDEGVGHWIWYLGLLLVIAAVSRAVLDDRGAGLRTSAAGVALALLTGFSLANTWIEGRTPWLGLAAAVSFAAWGLRRRTCGGMLWVACFGLALVQLVGWGTYWWLSQGRLFPEYYEVFTWL
jgi:hypothetical protein